MKCIGIILYCAVVAGLSVGTTIAEDRLPESSATQQLSSRWALFEERIRTEEYAAASDEINQLVVIRDSAGISALPGYARELIAQAWEADAAGDSEQARILFRWALRLAPETPEILIQALPVYKKYGLGSLLGLVKSIVFVTWSSPSRLLTIGAQCTYFLLNALSWTLYFAFIVVLAGDLMNIFRVLAWYVKPAFRGILLPILFLTIFALPLCFGFLWCLACWAVAVFAIIPERRRLSLATGIVILAWGVLIPVVENISSWLESAQVERVLLSSDQPLREEERQSLESELSLWSSDSVVQFKFAQLLRRAHQIEAAERVLIYLEQVVGIQSWIAAEKGVLLSLRGDFSAAEKALRSAVEKGNNSPEVLFNLSKVVFELSNTKESRELFGQALKKSKIRVEQMRKREEVLGIHDARSYADVDLPMLTYIQAALIPNHLSFPRAEAKAREIMKGLDPRFVTLIGIILILMHVSGHQRARRINPKGLFERYVDGIIANALVPLIPGGVLIIKARFRIGFLILFSMVLSLAPVINGSLPSIAWVFPYYVCIWLGAYFALALWSIQSGRE